MDISEYRRRYEAELDKAAGPESSRQARRAGEDDVAAITAALHNTEPGSAAWTAALETASVEVDEHPELIDTLCGLLRDNRLPGPARLAVLAALQEISFRMVRFPAKRPVYLETLRSIVDDDEAALRRRAIAILAREKDAYAQQRLIDGLEGRGKKLVPDAKAVQFLGYDLHAEHFPILRRIAERPPNPAARREAVRLLGADPESEDLLSSIVEDKNEQPEIRAASAVALQAGAPERFERQARRMVLDDDEDDEMRAMSISALTLFAAEGPERQDTELGRRVEQLRQSSTSPQLKKAANDYLSKPGGELTDGEPGRELRGRRGRGGEEGSAAP